MNEYVENSAWQRHGYRHFQNGFIVGCAFMLVLVAGLGWIWGWL